MKCECGTECYRDVCRSRKGAWIEITATELLTPPRSRSRKGAWIEMLSYVGETLAVWVAPARERGLKLSLMPSLLLKKIRSLPQGSVD